MAEVIDLIVNSYNSLISLLPNSFVKFLNLFLLVLLVLVYSIFVWKLHKFISKKNIISLNLNKYNRSSHPFFEKLFAGFLYIIEYILILPFLAFIWFSVFSIFLILLNNNLQVDLVLFISAAVITAIRMAAYYDEDLSREIAKLLPFTLLAISLF